MIGQIAGLVATLRRSYQVVVIVVFVVVVFFVLENLAANKVKRVKLPQQKDCEAEV